MIFTSNLTTINCGYLSNIVFDYDNGKITTEKEFVDIIKTNNFSFDEENKLIKWYNRAKQDGAMSVAHFKLVCIVCSIIKKHRQLYYQRTICPSIYRGVWKWINPRC